jgi:hypothetical protein
MGAAARTLDSLPAVYRDADLALYRIGGHRAGPPADRRLGVLGAHLAWLALLVGGAVGLITAGRRHVSREPLLGERK